MPAEAANSGASFHPSSALQPMSHRSFRRQLYALGIESCFVIGVTSSPNAREQKARAAAELALALADPNQARVLLVDADFEDPQVHALLGITVPPALRLSEQLRQHGARESAAGWGVIRCTRSLHALVDDTSGPAPDTSLSACVHALRGDYDFIVVAAAPARAGQIELLAEFVDGAVIVALPHETTEIQPISRHFRSKRLLKILRAS
jgi:Mrp family chromosome partitioning ATPase